MMTAIMTTLTTMSTMAFLQMNHPLATGLMLLIQTTLISVMVGMMSKTFWFSYVLFMVFLGGMLVLFIYVAALASNEMFSMSANMMMIFMVIMTMMILAITMSDMYMAHPTMHSMETMTTENLKSYYPENSLNLIKLYNYPTNHTTIMLMSYLLITLIAVVKVTNVFEGPLRKIN